MKRLVRYGFLVAFLVCAPRVNASTTAGGACPSPANMDGGPSGGGYAAPTNCYYVDFANGSDSNSGTDEAHPFKHAVGMMGAGGNVPTSCSAGVGWIFKGGVTWDYTIWPWYIGAGANCTGDSGGNDAYGGCTGSHCIYFGVDHSWYAGASWTRPILSGGDWANPPTNTVCNYDVDASHPGFQPTNLWNLSYQSDIIIDNFELTAMCAATTTNYLYPQSNFISSTNGSGGTNFTIENVYIHRSVYPAACLPGGSVPNQCGVFEYGIGVGNETLLHITYCVFDFSDSGPTTTTTQGQGPLAAVWTAEAIYQGVTYIDHSVAAYMTDFSSNAWGTVRDNLLLQASNEAVFNTSPSGHQNTNTHSHITNDSGCTTYNYWYNNVIDTVASGYVFAQQAGTPNNPCTAYMFNNILTNVNTGRVINFGSTSAGITTYLFNNTLECGDDTSGGMGGPPNNTCGDWGSSAADYVYNNHFITQVGTSAFTCGQSDASGPCPSFTDSLTTVTNATFNQWPGGTPADLVTQTQAAANAQGYAYTQAYEFSPTSSNGATVGKGINEAALCNSLPDGSAAAACMTETTGGVTYNTTNHTAVCCAISSPVARPSTGAWDVGAYQFSAASGSAPAPPSGLTATID